MREVFELSRKHYYTHKEIADELGISEEAVNKQIKRLLKHLRLKLGLLSNLLICYHHASHGLFQTRAEQTESRRSAHQA